MTTLRINITREVLEKTKDCKSPISQNCAVAYAVREIWPTAGVGYGEIDCHTWGGIVIKHNQKRFVQAFDSATPAERAAMTPFSFDIEVSDEVINEVNIEEVKRICEGSKTLELVKC